VKAPGMLGDLSDAMLSHNPKDRPALHEVAAALRQSPTPAGPGAVGFEPTGALSRPYVF